MKRIFKLSIITVSTIAVLMTGCGGGGESGTTAKDGSIPAKPITTTVTETVESNTTLASVPNKVLTLNTNTTDTDNDGMIDDAEIKYGFNPNDENSIPTTPTVIPAPTNIAIDNSGIGAVIVPGIESIKFTWNNTPTVEYILKLSNGTNIIVDGGHDIDSANIVFNKYSLNGDENLTGNFVAYDHDSGDWIEDYDVFTVKLSEIDTARPTLGLDSNKISFTFKDFDDTNKEIYTNFLTRLWPIMYKYLGNPAENFNCVITNMGEDSDYFMISNAGRTFLTTKEFIPRLIIHEFVHAWKGNYQITADENWDYSTDLSGFEEGLAEGMAFVIGHEFVKSYPTSKGALKLLDYKPYQYHSVYTTTYDLLKTQRTTGAGEYWTMTGSETYRYSISAVTIQNIVNEYPNFYKDTQALIYNKINTDDTWRSTRSNIMDIWSTVAPTVQGINLVKYLDALPVFNGKNNEDGFYIQTIQRQYGGGGDQQFALAYALNGKEWWSISTTDFATKTIPENITTYTDENNWVYPDMQNQPFTVNVYTDNKLVTTVTDVTSDEHDVNGKPEHLGWSMPNDLQQDNYELGLYKEVVSFNNYSDHNGSTETFYFMGTKDVITNSNETSIFIGVDTEAELATVTTNIDGLIKTTDVKNSLGAFKYGNELPHGYEATITIDVTSTTKTCTYKRTILDAQTMWNISEFNYVIVDKDFNCIEDIYE